MTVEKRIKENKSELIKLLKKTPIIQVACERCGISRATFYRWKNKDKTFAKEADKAIKEGTEIVNDMAVSQLISAIKDRNMGAIRFWLQNNDPRYAQKLKISGRVQREEVELTPKQKETVRKALRLAKITNPNKPTKYEQRRKRNNQKSDK